MASLFLLSPKTIGPVWPAMLLCLAYMLATTAFLILARLRSWFRSFTLREYRFLQRLFDATEMFSTLAILSGMIGTCLGLLEVLPVLGHSLQNAGGQAMLSQVLGPLQHVWASTIAGLALGGLWGEILLFILKPYTRPALMPISTDDPPVTDLGFEEPLAEEEPGQADDSDVDGDWRARDAQGMY